MSNASEWVDGLHTQIADFSRTRTPVVEVFLGSGQRFRVQRAVAGPGESWVTLDVYPEIDAGQNVLEQMVADDEGELHSARTIMLGLHQIARIELLHDADRAQTLGFRGPDLGSV
jgi:hypothetical protein